MYSLGSVPLRYSSTLVYPSLSASLAPSEAIIGIQIVFLFPFVGHAVAVGIDGNFFGIVSEFGIAAHFGDVLDDTGFGCGFSTAYHFSDAFIDSVAFGQGGPGVGKRPTQKLPERFDAEQQANLRKEYLRGPIFGLRIPAQLLLVTSSLSCITLPATYHFPGRFSALGNQPPSAQAPPGEYISRCSMRAKTARIFSLVA